MVSNTIVTTRITYDDSCKLVDVVTSVNHATASATCAGRPPIVEWFAMCDTDQATGDVTKFIRKITTTYGDDGMHTVAIENLELDRETPYAMHGVITPCPEEEHG